MTSPRIAAAGVSAFPSAASCAHSYIAVRNPSARLRVLCIPYAGGSAALFRRWQARTRPDVEVCPVEFAGRGERAGESLISDVQRVVKELADEVVAQCDGPLAVYGHSSGALTGFLLAARLGALGYASLQHLYVGAVASPDHAGEVFRQRCRHELGSAGYSGFPDAAEIRALPPTSLERLAGVLRFPADAARPDLLRAMLPVVINDLLMITSFGCSGASIVDVPITAVHGAFDDRVTEAEMRGWADWTSREYQIRILPGDHFFVHPDQCRDEVIELVTCLKSGIDE